LVAEDQKSFDDFVDENPKILLPADLYLESDLKVIEKENDKGSNDRSPVPSFKDDASPPSRLRWSGREKLRVDLIKSNMMIGGFWNIRGLGKPGRIKALNDFIKENMLDFVVVQKTKKAELSETTLNMVDSHMTWNYLLARGSSGGILVGFKSSTFEDISWQCFDYCVTAIVKTRLINSSRGCW
jgi:hypothetical protein